jgi:sterol desaturase/sphingolipid hydroxylase (fatty acid hydroxylase superfamily)
MSDSDRAILRWALLVAVFAGVALLEWVRPRRALVLDKAKRWTTHALFFLVNSAVGRLLAFLVAIPLAAQWSASHGFGLFHRVDLHWSVEALALFVLLDFAVWLQHLAMHKIPVLWRMHKVHHADRDLDVTTALRFHPFELIVSTLYKSAWVALLGSPVAVALAFEAWLNANALFNHGNLLLPTWLDRAIRPVLVTPDMHLVHHSTVPSEQQRNYGFALTVWDRLFGTYANESKMGRDAEVIGFAGIDDDRPAQLGWSLKFPLT